MNGTTQMWVRVPRPIREAVVLCAVQHDTTMSDVITRALEEYLHRVFPEKVELVRTRLP